MNAPGSVTHGKRNRSIQFTARLLPLATFAEYRRRHFLRWLPGTETGSVTVNIAGGDLAASDYVSAMWSNGLRGGQQLFVSGEVAEDGDVLEAGDVLSIVTSKQAGAR